MVCPFKVIGDQNASKMLAFNCDICSCQIPEKGDITKSSYCRQQFLQILPFIEGFFPCQFLFYDQSIFLPRSSMKLLKEYATILSKYKTCIDDIHLQYPEAKPNLFTDPYAAYKSIETTCTSSRKRSIREFISALEKTRLISKAQRQVGDEISSEQSNFLANLLKIKKRTIGYSNFTRLKQPFQLLNTYEVGPFRIRLIEFSRVPLEKYYQAVVSLDKLLSPNILHKLFSQYQPLSLDEIKLQTLEELIDGKTSEFRQYLRTHFKELSSFEQRNLAIYATAQTLNITKTIPLLLDDEVQEIFLDKPGTAYYLDHAVWGRCRSNLVPLESELSHIITRLRLESRRPLDEKTPSLKTELKTRLFHVRAAIDVPPLAYEGPHLNIRKIRLRTLTLPELIANRTISISAAAFLILCMTLRINITISGEPSTGKTTLANAINLLAPPHWRKIAIEDALESITIDEVDRHKVTFRVDPFDSFEKTRSTKSNEIIRLLHRSPDWVFLGEIQTAEHSAALFHAISAGIRGIQTCHANSNEELLLRWKIHHDIPEVCFRSLGVLVHMVREVVQGRIIRKVAQISEVQFGSEKTVLNPIFEWSKSSGQLEKKITDLFPTIISRTCRFQQQTPFDIRTRLRVYQQTLTKLVSNQEYNPKVVVSAFDEAYAKEVPAKRKNAKIQTKEATENLRSYKHSS